MPPRALIFATSLVLTVTLPACKSPCLKLAEKTCECEKTSSEREACVRRATDESSRVQVTEKDETLCAALLPGCDCQELATVAGKRACGLAREAPK
jgi:hypothetical protein